MRTSIFLRIGDPTTITQYIILNTPDLPRYAVKMHKGEHEICTFAAQTYNADEA